MSGGEELGPADLELLVWLARGYDVAGIAARTYFSVGWIYARLRRVRDLLGVRTNVGAVVEGLRLGLVGMPGEEEMWR